MTVYANKIAPGGKYRLTEGQAVVLLTLYRNRTGGLANVGTVRDIARVEDVRSVRVRHRFGGWCGMDDDGVRSALRSLMRLGLVERYAITPHRFAHRLTAEGVIDAKARVSEDERAAA